MRRRLIAVSFVLLLVCAVSVVAQRIRKHGGLIDISSAGAISIVPRSGQAAAVTGPLTVSTTLTVGTGTALTRVAYYTATLTPVELAASTCAEQLFTVTGVTAGDVVFVNKPTAQAGLGIGGVRASAANQVGINFCNATAVAITPTATQAYTFGVLR